MTIKRWRMILNIISRNSNEGENTGHPFHAEHDVIFFSITPSCVPMDSNDGRLLRSLHYIANIEQSGCWGTYV